MTNPDAQTAHALAHAQLGRIEQVIGMIWSAYPAEIDLDSVVDLLESEGLSTQNRARLRKQLNASRIVSRGKAKRSYRINPRYLNSLSTKYSPIVGAPRQIRVHDAGAVVPDGTIPLDRKYLKDIVRQINEGYVAEHYDSTAVMIRRLAESLTIEIYVRSGREAAIRANGAFLMFDGLIGTFAGDNAITKSRNIVRYLRKIKDVGDTAAHDRNYITKKADIDEMKSEARRCLSELASLAGL